MMICAISGEKAVEPVVSPRSGAIFEKKHIVNYLATSGTDPINNEPLTVEELVAINSSSPAIVPPITGTSIPALLSTFQNEWDSLALEVFSLRKQLHQARQELSTAFYHQDAAVRVAANAIKERDEAREALQQLASSIWQNATVSNGNTTSNVPVEEINQARDELFQIHKAMKPSYSVSPETEISVELVKNHGTSFDEPATAVSYEQDSKQLTIGSTTGILVRSIGSDKTESVASEGAVSAVAIGENGPLIAYDNKITEADKVLSSAHPQVLDIIVHPKLKHLHFLLGDDSKWSLNSTKSDPSLLYLSPKLDHPITTGAVHVDGALLAIGNDQGQVQIFNVGDGQLISTINASLPVISKIVFALNGYWVLVGSKQESKSTIDVIDLRKNTIVHTIAINHEIVDCAIDPSSSVVVACDSTNTLSVHRYIKKGKKWYDNVVSKSLSDDLGGKNVLSIALVSSHDDPAFRDENKIGVAVVGQDSRFLEYQLTPV